MRWSRASVAATSRLGCGVCGSSRLFPAAVAGLGELVAQLGLGEFEALVFGGGVQGSQGDLDAPIRGSQRVAVARHLAPVGLGNQARQLVGHHGNRVSG